ncbi:MAG: hypothetical protein HY904_21660 [Deltaproteobacteria bacterium]|nr:hypothetical protein [Deltaproteobacteria bacterium]
MGPMDLLHRVAPGRPAALALLLAAHAAGCATYQDHMRAGRYATACAMVRDTPDESLFRTWVQEHWTTHVARVPREQVEQMLGGPVAGYGVGLALYEVTSEIPGGRVSLQPPAGALRPHELIALMQPLVLPDEPVLPPGPLDVADFQPAAPPAREEARSSSGSGLMEAAGSLLGAFFDVGRVVGAVAMLPAALTVGITVGSMEVFVHGLGGVQKWTGALGGTYVPPPPASSPVFDVPVFRTRSPKPQGRADALLTAEEYEALVATRRAAWEERSAAVEAERQRRLELGNRLGGLVSCRVDGPCRLVAVPGKHTVDASTSHVQGDDWCETYGLTRELDFPPVAEPGPPWPAPRGEPAMVLEDASAPAWAQLEAVTTDLPWPTATAALGAEGLLCQVSLRKAAWERGTPPALTVRVTTGRETPRVQRWHLGTVRKTTSFVVPAAHLQAGERLRLGFADPVTQRGLGGGMVEMTGALPLVVASPAVEARCTALPADALAAAITARGARMDAALDALDAALQARDPDRVARSRAAARRALVDLAQHSGWVAPALAERWARFTRVDPAERR